MKLNHNSNHNSQNKINRSHKGIISKDFKNLNYLYPDGHRVTHQMKWFKGSRDRALRSDIAA